MHLPKLAGVHMRTEGTTVERNISALSALAQSSIVRPATKLLINNRWVPSESGETFATVNPSTGEEICQVAAADTIDVDKAVHAARAAFETGPWRKMHASERGRLLYILADLIENNSDELARLESLDNGKPVSVAKRLDVAKTVACYRYSLDGPIRFRGKRSQLTATSSAIRGMSQSA
jgi:aldehyde dehydrogenase (NAD+)